MNPTGKKIIWLLFILSFIIFNKIGFSEERQSFKPRLSIKFTGGGGYVAIGDMNKHLDSMNNYKDYSGISMSEVRGKIEKLNNWLSDWEMELKIDGSPKIGVGIATSFFHRRNQSSIYAYQVPEYGRDHEMIFKPEIKVIMPFGLKFYYSIYSGSKLNVFINSGIGFYLGKMTENKIQNFIYPDGDVYFDNRYWEVENRSLGFQGGVGFEYNLIKNLALVVELQGRHIKIDNLKGTVKYETNFGRGLSGGMGGTLHFFEMDYYYDLDIPLPAVFFSEIEPIERNAVLDLSGFLLRIGIRIKLF